MFCRHGFGFGQEEVKDELAKEEWWRVILHNDEIHTFDYVTESITKASQSGAFAALDGGGLRRSGPHSRGFV